MANAPADTSNVAFAVIYRPEWSSQQVFSHLQEIVDELVASESSGALLEREKESAQAKNSAERSYKAVLKAFPPDERKIFLDALSRPFNQSSANAIRKRYDAGTPDEQACWGALVAMAVKSGAITWNGNQVRAICRAAWSAVGLRAHPQVVNVDCPNCGKGAALAFSIALNGWNCLDWRLACSACKYSDNISPSFELRKVDLKEAEFAVRSFVQSSPAVTGNWALSKKRRADTMARLRAVRATFLTMLDEELNEVAREAKEKWLRESTVGSCTSLCLHLHPLQHLSLGVAPVLKDEHLGGSSWLRTQFDIDLRHFPTRQTQLRWQPPAHPALHWQDEFEASLARWELALDGDGAVEAAVQTLVFVRTCMSKGLVTPLVVDFDLPPELRPAGVAPPRTRQATHIHAPIPELAAFLAQALSTPVHKVDEHVLAEILARFSGSGTH